MDELMNTKLKEEFMERFRDIQYVDLPIHNDILETMWNWIEDHFTEAGNTINTPPLGSKSLPNDYINKAFGKKVK